MKVRLSHLLACLAATVDHLEAESSVRLTRSQMLEFLSLLEALSADREMSSRRFDDADEVVPLSGLFDGFDNVFPAGRATVHHPRFLLPSTVDPNECGIGLARAFADYARLVVDGHRPSRVRPRPALSPAAKMRLRDALWSGMIELFLVKGRAMRVRIREAALIAQAEITFSPAFGRCLPARPVPALN